MQRSSSDHEKLSVIGRTLVRLTGTVLKWPRLTLTLVIVSAIAATVLTTQCLKMKTNRADLIDPKSAYHQRWASYIESFGDVSELVVAVEAPDPDEIKNILESLGQRLGGETELFRDVLFKIEPGNLPQKGLQYLPPQQLEAGLKGIESYRPILRGEWELLALDSMLNRYHAQISEATAAGSDRRVAALVHQLSGLSNSLNTYLADSRQFVSPWPALMPIDQQMQDEAHQTVYLMNDSGTMGFLRIYAVASDDGFEGAAAAIGRLREIVSQVQGRHPQAQIGITGIPVLENDEMKRSQDDMMRASIVSVVGVGILLLIGFRGLRHPALAMIMLAVGIAWTFGYTTLAVGHLNILSVSFAVILIGLGIDFAIHYLARYLELRHKDHDLQPALLKSSASVGTGIVTAAITTALAFYCATFTTFLGVAELGVIAGGGILLCTLATFLVLPPVVKLADAKLPVENMPRPFQGEVLRWMTLQHPAVALLLSAVLIGAAGWQALRFEQGAVHSRVGYDYNLLNLQAEGIESVEVQQRIFDKAGSSLLYAVSLADSEEEARARAQQFQALPTVSRVVELGKH